MTRKLEIVSRSDWDQMTASLDGDLQLSLAATLSSYEEAPNVGYYSGALGRIDSDSSPFPTDDLADD